MLQKLLFSFPAGAFLDQDHCNLLKKLLYKSQIDYLRKPIFLLRETPMLHSVLWSFLSILKNQAAFQELKWKVHIFQRNICLKLNVLWKYFNDEFYFYERVTV